MEDLKFRENKTQDVLINLNSYLELASTYISNNDSNKELFHIGILIERMQEEVKDLIDIYKISS